MTDMLIAAQRALTETETEQFLANFVALNPSWRGAHVADVLEVLDSTDAHLGVIESLYDDHQKDVPEPRLLAIAGYLSIYVDGNPDVVAWERVQGFVERVRSALVSRI